MKQRLQTLTLLERMRRHAMLAEARELAGLRAEIARMETVKASLLAALTTEARTVSLEAAPYVGAYIRSVRDEVTRIDRAITGLDPRILALETAVMTQFREVATARLALSQTRARTQAEIARQATAEADTQTILRWARRH